MKVYKYCLIGICVFFFVRCSQNEIKRNPCTNKISLISPTDSFKNITIDYRLKSIPLQNSIEEQLGEVVCGTLINFGLILENQEIIKIQYRKKCQDEIGIISCYKELFSVEALLNENGNILFGHESIPIDSIKYRIRDKFWDDGSFYYNKTSVQWETQTPKDSIEKVFSSIKDGYLLIYEKMAEKHFTKKVCELKPAQLTKLKEELPFSIELSLYRVIPPPPPIPVDSLYK